MADNGQLNGATLGFESKLWAAADEEAEDDGVPFEKKMAELTATLGQQFKESARLEKEIRRSLKSTGFAGEA